MDDRTTTSQPRATPAKPKIGTTMTQLQVSLTMSQLFNYQRITTLDSIDSEGLQHLNNAKKEITAKKEKE